MQLHHGIKNDTVLLAVEIITVQNFRCRHDRILIHDHGSDDGLLCFYTMW